MLLGTIGSIGHGASIPLLWLMFGHITDSFTANDLNLCSIDFQNITRLFCPENVYLTQHNFRQQYKYHIYFLNLFQRKYFGCLF